MIDITKDIQSLTTFRRRSGDFMKQLKKNKRPVVLTVKGKAAANRTHHEVGAKVRQTIRELGGTMPEHLPVAESIKKLETKERKQIGKAKG